ncbi:DUF4347 domain-containing protein [Stieleria sp. ICT_E10.1]|uniref:DUF4347 domain-containing protein n=1 Tax=Stieleria sedimenti TaxID=2976331 RepID=UPI0021801C4A|nr:DUF4347 domain-containing protein [Stieleria sedimenti]MCS7468412.1 DUF4347 domain-containing protein [Stieleria sedimenti]
MRWRKRKSIAESSVVRSTGYLLDAAVLEKRLLFSATPMAPPQVEGVPSDSDLAAPTVDLNFSDTTFSDTASTGQTSASSSGDTEQDKQQRQRLELVFVDAGVQDYQSLIADLRSGNEHADLEIYLLDARRDGVRQIGEILHGYADVDAIHVLSHGNDGKLRLGNTVLDDRNLAGYAGEFAGWAAFLNDQADVMLYGCELAETVDGRTMLEALAELTGADVAASVDDTGSGSLGGDWELEFATGLIESDSILAESYDATWSGLLATPEIATTGERLVNSPATGNQSILKPQQAVAVDGLGNSIVTWVDYSADLNGTAVMAQRFDSFGAKLGGQFQVNVDTDGDQTLPVVTADASGRFAIAYVSDDEDGTGIYVRRYDASGAAIDATDILVNAGSEAGDQTNVSIASNSNNQIVLSWETSNGSTEGIFARNFDYTSTPVGNALSTTLLTVDSASSAGDAVVDINEGGRFVVLWKDGSDAYARKYDFGAATALDSKLDVNYPGAIDRQLAIAVKPNNDYIVVYREDTFFAQGIWTRTVQDDGTLIFPERIISVSSAEAPSIAMDAAGNYVISYTQLDGSGMGVKYISFDATDFQVGGVESVSQSTSGSQINASVAMHDLDNFVVVWSGQGDQPGQVDSAGVFARQYGTAVVANTAPLADLSAGAPYTINEGDSLSLDGSNSSDANGDTLTFAWDLDNDGNFGETDEPTTATATVNWATLASFGIDDDGTYTIGLRVDDGNGGVTTQTTTVTVNNSAPSLIVSGNASVAQGATYTLNLSANDPGDDTLTGWRIDWGDGTITTHAGTATSVNHTYNVAGLTHNILVSATDEDGKWLTGDLFLANATNTPVHRYDALTGAFELSTGVFNQLKYAEEILIGPDGQLYVSAFNSDKVQRFDPVTGVLDGDFVAARSGGLDGASGMAFGPDGNLYVGSFSSDEVLRYDGTTGAFIDAFVTAGSAGLDGTRKIFFGDDGYLYVASAQSNSVLRFDGTTGAYVDDFVTAGSGGLDTPTSFAFGADGNFYVASFLTDEVLRYNGTTGAFIDTFVTAGLGGLNEPFAITFGADDYVYVSDHWNQRIVRYDTSGNFVDSYITGLFDPKGMAFTPTHQVTVTATPNTIPLATNLNQSKNYTEGDAGVALDDIVVTDPDGGQTITATLTLNLPATGALTTGTFGASTSTYNGGSGVWTVTGSVADVNAALAAVAFTPATDNDIDSQITVRVRDSLGDGPVDGLIQLNVTAQNDPTFIDLDGDDSSGVFGTAFNAAFVEGGGPVRIADATDAVITDVDNSTLTSLTVTITNLADGTDESLTAVTAGTNIAASYAGGTLTLSGTDSIANYQQVLRTIRYNNVSATPTTTPRALNLNVYDGTGVTSIMTTVSVAAVNTAPSLDLDGDDSSGAAGTGYDASFIEGGGAVLIADVTDATLADLDSLNLFSLTATITNSIDGAAETLSADTSGTSITASFAGGTLTLSGVDSVANYQQVLRTIRYHNASLAPDPTTRTISFVANDGSIDGNVANATVSVTSVNSPPTIVVPGTQTPSEDIAWQINGISFNDLDLGTATMQFSFDVSRGSLTLDLTVAGGVTAANVTGNGGSAVEVNASLAQMNATLAAASGLTYVSDPNVSGAETLVVTANDWAASTLANVGINVLPVNDAPVAAADFYTMDPDITLSVGPAGILANDVDVDGDTLTVVPVNGPSSGTLTLGSDGSFQFTPLASFSGTVSFSYAVTDGIATSSPVTVVIKVSLPISPADIQSVKSEPEPDVPPEQPVADDTEETEQEDESQQLLTEVSASDSGTDVQLVFTSRGVVQTGEDAILSLSVMPQRAAMQADAVVEDDEARTASDSENGRVSSRHRKESSRDGVSFVGIAKFDSKLLWSDMEDLQHELKQDDRTPYIFAGSFAGVSSALSVGYVMWTVRGGLLATSLLAHLPAWSFVDPLLVLNEFEEDEDGDDDSLEEMLDKSESGKSGPQTDDHESSIGAADPPLASLGPPCE